MASQTPEPISHTTEMVIATVVGAGVGLTTNQLLLGAIVGVALGIVLSIGKTLYVERKRRKPH
jgi:hypothetical protein